MTRRTVPRQWRLLYSLSIFLSLVPFAGCTDSVPASPNPIPSAKAGQFDYRDPKSLHGRPAASTKTNAPRKH
jgi:hypothetical protein